MVLSGLADPWIDGATRLYPFRWTPLAVAFVAAMVVGWALRQGGGWNRAARFGNAALTTLALISTGALIAAACWHAWSPLINSPNEANLMAVSWYWGAHHPLYHDLDSAERYSMLYGPAAYLVNRASMECLGPSLFSAKLPGLLGVAGALALTAALVAREAGWRLAVLLTGYCALVLMVNPYGVNLYYAPRGDAQLLFWLAAALWSVRWKREGAGAVLAGLAAAMAVNTKMNLAPLLLAIPALAAWRTKPARLAAYFGSALLAGVVPFLIPGISLANYLRWLQLAGRHGLEPDPRFFLRVAFHLLLPMLAVGLFVSQSNSARLRLHLKESRLRLAGIALAFGLIAISAMKVGSGAQHLAALTPFLALLAALVWKDLGPDKALEAGATTHDPGETRPEWRVLVAAALLVAFVTMSVPYALGTQIQFARSQCDPRLEALHRELAEVVTQNAGRTILMGYGRSDQRFNDCSYQFDLILADQPLVIDAIALMECQKAGEPLPQASLDWLEGLQNAVWLIPHGEPPFEVWNLYEPRQVLFPDAFREVFLRRFERTGEGEFFDRWQNRSGSSDSPKALSRACAAPSANSLEHISNS